MAVNLQRVGGAGSDANDATKSVNFPSDKTLSVEGAAVSVKPIYTASNVTAKMGWCYEVFASATFTDPTPPQEGGYIVRVRNGTATIGTDSFTEGEWWRVWHSGGWTTVRTGFTAPTPADACLAIDAASLESNNRFFARNAFSGGYTVGDPSSTSPVCVFLGDSITNGTGATTSFATGISLSNYNGLSIAKVISGHPSYKLSDLESTTEVFLHLYFSEKSGLNLVVIFAGTNDIALEGASVGLTFSRLEALARRCRYLGWKVAVCTMLSRVGFDSEKNDYNSRIRANWRRFSDLLVDFASIPELGADGAYANTTYFGDGVHPNDTGSALLTAFGQATVNSFISTGLNVAQANQFQTESAGVGEWVGFPGFAWFGHKSGNTATQYGILQNEVCQTYINGTSLSLRVNNTEILGSSDGTGVSFSVPITGNISTASALATARTINGVSFDGTSNITIPVHVVSYSAGALRISGDDGHVYELLGVTQVS